MKIGIDIDDVITETMRGYLDEINKGREKEIDFEEVNGSLFWEKVFGFSKDQVKEFLDGFFEKKAYELDLIEGAKEGLCLLDQDHDICFITSRPIEFKEKTTEFLKKNIPGLEPKIFHSEINVTTKEGKDKIDLCEELGIDLIIEDQKRFARTCANRGVKVILFRRPWNDNLEGHENITRVKNWEEILEVLK
ncbi:hypothetical protein ISS08_01650 [Candidatus Pacearchaeota archaeon]|nr:hypothetical protein [Candidatus Pacearchaeota archaeon]